MLSPSHFLRHTCLRRGAASASSANVDDNDNDNDGTYEVVGTKAAGEGEGYEAVRSNEQAYEVPEDGGGNDQQGYNF